MDLREQEANRRLATSREAATGVLGCGLVCGALLVWAFAVLLIVEGAPQVVWAIVAANGLAVLAVAFYRLKDRQADMLEETDMEPKCSQVRSGLQRHRKRMYLGLTLVHAASAAFLAVYYGIQWFRRAPLARERTEVGIVTACLALLSLWAWWRARACRSRSRVTATHAIG